MKASEHLALCEGKRGGASAEERVLCAELEAAEARCKQATGIIRFLKTWAPNCTCRDQARTFLEEATR